MTSVDDFSKLLSRDNMIALIVMSVIVGFAMYMSGDKAMIDAFNNGDDIHAITASQVFNVPLENVTKQMRSEAKAVNFGIIYGQTRYGLAETLSITPKEAKKLKETTKTVKKAKKK